ncbi:hypothetical protein B0H19DRAFT_1063237 [Mycena capillaripes]|nr:hypothetical protein B0H19DRAFT_1063237 [Mycena capillaripes]
MIALLISPLVVVVPLAVPAASLANTSTYRIPDFPSVSLPQPSFWQELATSHFYIPLILLASALGRYIASQRTFNRAANEGAQTTRESPVQDKFQMQTPKDSKTRAKRPDI